MIKRHKIKSCCGKSNLMLEAPKGIRKHQVSIFEQAGYEAPQSHKDIGVFYVRGNGIIATAPYGSKRVTVYCGGSNCDEKISAFEILLEQAVSN